MAEDITARQMSLVPYTYDNREVLLQQGSAIVVYDNQSRQLSVRHDSDVVFDLVICPACHRPLHEDIRRDSHEDSSRRYDDRQYAGASQSFVDPEYFGMLAQSQRTTPVSSTPGTPTNRPQRFYQPALRSGRSRDVSGSQPLPDAEFVASEPAPSRGKGISSSAFSPGYFKQFFREERELGRGGNGVVLLVEHVLDGVSLGHFACKRIPVGNDHRWLEKVLVEVKLLAQVPHKNLVKYHWVWVEEHQTASFGPSVPCVWILQEYCNGGDLHNYVLGPRDTTNTAEKLKARHRKHSRGNATPPVNLARHSKLTLEEIFSFFRDITSGLHHLHAKGYIHRDVKPSNCLLSRSEGRIRVLLSDFGEVQATGTSRGSTGATGTISYCAPEVLHQQRDGRYGDFTTKSDIFSLGMIVYFMCFGKLPYVNADDINEDNEDLDLLRAEIIAWRGFDDMSGVRDDLPERLYKYLQRLLSVDPLQRPSTEEILTSIRASTGFGDATMSLDSDAGSPQSSMPQQSRRASYFGGRALLSTVGRSLSNDKIRRSPSPIKRSTDSLEPPSGIAGVVLRPRKIERGPGHSPPPPQISPRLTLPPPEPRLTLASRYQQLVNYPILRSVWLRAALCLVKLVMLLGPCSPYTPNPWVLYPLFALALSDLIDPFDLSRSTVLVAVHIATAWAAHRAGAMCQGIGESHAWEVYERNP